MIGITQYLPYTLNSSDILFPLKFYLSPQQTIDNT